MRGLAVATGVAGLLAGLVAFGWALHVTRPDSELQSALEQTAVFGLVLAAVTTSAGGLLVALQGRVERAWPLLGVAALLYLAVYLVPLRLAE